MPGRYGRTDPSAYQLRDMNRRITRLEKKLDTHIVKDAYKAMIVAKQISLITKIRSTALAADLEEE